MSHSSCRRAMPITGQFQIILQSKTSGLCIAPIVCAATTGSTFTAKLPFDSTMMHSTTGVTYRSYTPQQICQHQNRRGTCFSVCNATPEMMRVRSASQLTRRWKVSHCLQATTMSAAHQYVHGTGLAVKSACRLLIIPIFTLEDG